MKHAPVFSSPPTEKDRTVAVYCHGITKRFGTEESEVIALRGVDLSVNEGELMMLVGPSGCGKTTLISIIAGILSASTGSCTLFGKNFASLSDSERLDFRAKNIGFIFQAYNLLPSLNLAENVAIPLIIGGMDKKQAVLKAAKLLKDVGLGERIKNKPSQLSGGQQQRVAIARALVHQPKLLVCDEPTSALDHDTGQKIMQLIREMKQKFGTTIIIVTHDNRIFEYADRIAYMDDGVVSRVEAASRINQALHG